MNENNENKPVADEQKSLFGVIIHSFFVVPFFLAVFSVLLYASVRILTMENRTVYDYLNDVKVGGLTKRWQSAFELSKILANPKLVPKDPKFTTELIRVFDKSVSDDSRVRQYLALAMAKSGDPDFIPTLVKAAANEKDENLGAFVYALGILKANHATDILLTHLKSDDPRLRLVTIMALGNIGDAKALSSIKPFLNDVEPNVQWEAAVALAKNGDATAVDLLVKLLDREYLAKFPEVDNEEQAHVMLTAIRSSANLKNKKIAERLEKISTTDQNMNVRSAAFEALAEFNKS